MAELWRIRVAKFIGGPELASKLSAVTARVDDSAGYGGAGWANLTGRPHDYDGAKILEIYQDALQAWRKNPVAWRIIAITTDYIVGDEISISGTRRELQKFINMFWTHPKNRMDLRLESMSDELARAGDLFVLLFRNPVDGMSYIRFVTKDRITKIETAENDWETELVYYEVQPAGEPKAWLSPEHPGADQADAIMLHYAVNRPVGAIMGESDLVTMIPWLQRYSRMLEDRVRLHWAMRAFLWIVTVPTNKVREKQEQYRSAPESGSIVVKDESEKWESMTPLVRGADAEHDLRAVRQMVDAGSGYPPHWRGESGDANLATATAMQSPTERHLARRQKYFVYMVQDILYHAYQRSALAGFGRSLKDDDYSKLFSVSAPDVSRSDNEALARAARELAETFRVLSADLAAPKSAVLAKLMMKSVFKFAGEPQNDETLTEILAESQAAAAAAAAAEEKRWQEERKNDQDNPPQKQDPVPDQDKKADEEKQGPGDGD